MMGKLKETQQKVEETKKRLETVYVEESNADGSLTRSGNGEQIHH